MPLGDRTGPAGRGKMTGRKAGYCAGNNVPGYINPDNQARRVIVGGKIVVAKRRKKSK